MRGAAVRYCRLNSRDHPLQRVQYDLVQNPERVYNNGVTASRATAYQCDTDSGLGEVGGEGRDAHLAFCPNQAARQ